MAENARTTGIDNIGSVKWGTHICQFYRTKEDLTDILVPYFKAGLESNEYCLWIAADPLGVEEAKVALADAVDDYISYMNKEQLLIIDHQASYTPTGTFDASSMLEGIIDKEQFALSRGFDGLRLSGNVSWLSQDQWASFIDYELTLDIMIRKRRIITICSYPLEGRDPPEIVDAVINHRLVLIQRRNGWALIPNTGYGQIANLRNKGLSYAEIGRRIGLSRQRITKIMNDRSKKPYPSQKTLLSVGQVAEHLNVHVNTVRRWADSGILPSYRFGKRLDRKFHSAALDKFIIKSLTDNSY